jgi:hypothetical protein
MGRSAEAWYGPQISRASRPRILDGIQPCRTATDLALRSCPSVDTRGCKQLETCKQQSERRQQRSRSSLSDSCALSLHCPGHRLQPPQGRCHFFPPYYKPVPRRLHRDAEWFTQQRVLTGPCFRPTFHTLAKLYTGQSVMPRDARQGDRVLASDPCHATCLAAHAERRAAVSYRAARLFSRPSRVNPGETWLPPAQPRATCVRIVHASEPLHDREQGCPYARPVLGDQPRAGDLVQHESGATVKAFARFVTVCLTARYPDPALELSPSA